MTWQPRLELLSVAKFRDAAKAFMEEHFDEALAWAATQCGLSQVPAGVEGFFYSLGVREKRPVVNLLTRGDDGQDDDDGNRVERKLLTIEVERTAQDADDLVKVLEPYMLAVRSMLIEMDEEDWWRGASRAGRDDLDVQVGRERYSGRSYENEKTFLQVGSVEVVITYTQT